MPVDINGYVLANASGLKFNTSNTKVAATSYGVIDPMLPGMLGSVTDGSATYKVYPYPVNAVNVNIGSCWSTSTFRFTAPVAGIYYISFGGIVGDGTGAQAAGYYAIIINGTNTYWGYRDTLSTWEFMHIEGMYKVQAGDTIAWAMNFAPGPVSSYPGGAYRNNHNVCTIWLVG